MSTTNPSKNKKSICFVIPNWATRLGTGGAELQCYYLSEELLKEGWKVEILIQNRNHKVLFGNMDFYNSSIKIHTYKRTPLRSLNIILIFIKLLKTSSSYYYNRTDAKILRGTCALYCKLWSKEMIFAIANDSDIIDKDTLRKNFFVKKWEKHKKVHQSTRFTYCILCDK